MYMHPPSSLGPLCNLIDDSLKRTFSIFLNNLPSNQVDHKLFNDTLNKYKKLE